MLENSNLDDLDILSDTPKHEETSHNGKRKSLGRGLGALLGDSEFNLDEALNDTPTQTVQSADDTVAIDSLYPSPFQPRKDFDEEALNALVESIKEKGVLQPLLVRRKGDKYEIIAGERRWRASQMAGLTAVPAYIRTIKDENVMEMALVENIQREDLNAIEIALAYEHLLSSTGMTQEKVAERVGKSRTAIANYLRLLKLPAQVQMALQNKEIDMGHARALLAVDSPSLQVKLFKEIQKNGYSVRKVEEMVQKLKNGEDVVSGKKKIAAKQQMPEEYSVMRQRLTDFFNAPVQMSVSAGGKGKISIPFANEKELERIIAMFDKLKDQQ